MDKSSVLRKFPGVLGAAIAAGSAAYSLGKRAYSSIDKTASFPTWSTSSRVLSVGDRWSTMPGKYFPARRISGRRRMLPRMAYRPRYTRRSGEFPKRMVRSSAVNTLPLVAGALGIQTNIRLDTVQTSDLIAIYRVYRIRKVVLHLYPRVNPSNSGITNNAQATVCAANDPEGGTLPTSLTQVGAYSNHRQASQLDREFVYTFYPKAVNTVDIAGTSAAVGSYGMNPWLQMNATGITVPHRQLLVYFQTSNPAATYNVDYWWDIHFDVKGIA